MKNKLFVIVTLLSTGHLALAMEHNVEKVTFKHRLAQLRIKPKTLFTRGPGYWTTPLDENKTDFLGESLLTDATSQREDWYAVTPYIAEFWCTVSNALFIYYGIQQKSPELTCAGLASIISHAIPKKWLHHLDILGVGLVGLKALREYKIVYNNPTLLWPLAAAGIINGADTYLARTKGITWPHVTWHLSAALLMNHFLTSLKK